MSSEILRFRRATADCPTLLSGGSLCRDPAGGHVAHAVGLGVLLVQGVCRQAAQSPGLNVSSPLPRTSVSAPSSTNNLASQSCTCGSLCTFGSIFPSLMS